MRVRPLEEAERPWLEEAVRTAWGLPVVSVSGTYDPGTLPALVAEDEGGFLGVATYRAGRDGYEVVTLNSFSEGRGVGSALLEALHGIARSEGQRLWLITTDDNPHAVAFYRGRGMEIVRIHRDFVEAMRRHKPDVVAAGGPGTALRHAIEFQFAP